MLPFLVGVLAITGWVRLDKLLSGIQISCYSTLPDTNAIPEIISREEKKYEMMEGWNRQLGLLVIRVRRSMVQSEVTDQHLTSGLL